MQSIAVTNMPYFVFFFIKVAQYSKHIWFFACMFVTEVYSTEIMQIRVYYTPYPNSLNPVIIKTHIHHEENHTHTHIHHNNKMLP